MRKWSIKTGARSLLVFALCASGCYLLYRMHPARMVLIRIEPLIAPICILAGILGIFITWLSGPAYIENIPLTNLLRRLRRSMANPGLLVGVFFLICMIPIWSTWDRMFTNERLMYDELLGRLSWSDANAYVSGGHHLLYSGDIDQFNCRRPINSILFAVRLLVSGFDQSVCLILQGLLLAWALSLAVRSVSSFFGFFSSLAFLGLVHGYARIFSPSTLSETLGLTVSLLSCSLAIAGFQDRRLLYCALSSFTCALALSVRAGAYLILPFLMFAFLYRLRFAAKPLLALVASALAGLLFNYVIVLLYGAPGGAVNANFSATLLALSTNSSSWETAIAPYSRELSTKSEEVKSAFWRQRAIESLKKDPSKFFASLRRGWKEFSIQLPSVVTTITAMPGRHPGRLVLVLLLFLIVAFMFNARGWPSRDILFFIFPAIGILCSIPIIWIDGRDRVLASVYPFATLPVLFSFSLSRAKNENSDPAATLPVCVVVMCLVIFAAPLVLPWIVHHPSPSVLDVGEEGTIAIIRGDTFQKNGLLVTDDASLDNDRAISYTEFKKTIAASGAEDTDIFKNMTSPFVMANGFDIAEGRSFIMVGPPSILNSGPVPFLRVSLRTFNAERRIAQINGWEPVPW